MSCAQTASTAFDGIAGQYDELFTNSAIGRAQRNAVWKIAGEYLQASSSVLELNCGTGEDAFFLANCGMRVLACDVSEKMIEIARNRQVAESGDPAVRFEVLAIEDIGGIANETFDAVFSNFSGLNCVADLRKTAADMAQLLRPGAVAILCFSNKYCLWESIWYFLHGKARKACRRWGRDPVEARIGNDLITVRYSTIRAIVSGFSANFMPIHVRGVGVTVPPSYLEPWFRRSPAVVNAFGRMDEHLSTRWPFRYLGDHVVVVLKRTAR